MVRVLTFILLVVFCGLGEVPISALVMGWKGTHFDVPELIRHGVLVVYGISVFGSACYTLFKEHRPLSGGLILLTAMCVLVLGGGAICYALEFAEAISKKLPLAFSDFSMVVQYICAAVALWFALITEFKSPPNEAPPGYSHLRLN
jgi:hypothetical protein